MSSPAPPSDSSTAGASMTVGSALSPSVSTSSGSTASSGSTTCGRRRSTSSATALLEAQPRARVLAVGALELGERVGESPGAVAGWHLHHESGVEVAGLATLGVWRALAAQTQALPALTARR